MMGFDPFLMRQRSEELRREAQTRHLENRLRTRREHRSFVERVTILIGVAGAPRGTSGSCPVDQRTVFGGRIGRGGAAGGRGWWVDRPERPARSPYLTSRGAAARKVMTKDRVVPDRR